MWKGLSVQWQTAFAEAWIAFCTGNIPIGAAVFDENGELLLKDHNRTQSSDAVNRRIAHAEANILRRLDTAKSDPKKLVLYTTMEPCPMCMGTAVISNIRHLRSAARDPHCGMMHLMKTEPYFTGKALDYTFEYGDAELVQLAMQGYFELRCMESGAGSCVFDAFREQCPDAAEIAGRLYADKTLDRFVAEGAAFAEVYDGILSMSPDAASE